MKNLILIPILLLALHLTAQECDTKIHDAAEQAQLEKNIQNYFQKSEAECTKIRTVVHVIYNGKINNTSFNGWISGGQVLSQIRITNMSLRNDSLRYNADNAPLGYTIQLADTDPDGNPTNGIVYHDGYALWGESWANYGLKHSHPNAISESVVASDVGWNTEYIPPYIDDRTKYLNIYVVPKIDGNSGGGIQAYAYLPTTNAVYGSYVLYNAFGSRDLQSDFPQTFNLKTYTRLGFTFTHELGHNLGLFHTFQGNSCFENNCALNGDRVCDTPPQTQGHGCTGACGELSYNVMDYISPVCKNRFTPGQATRVNAAVQHNLQRYLMCPPDPPEKICDNNGGDFNNDGYVNILDLSWMVFLFSSMEGDDRYETTVDMNCDGRIDILDFSLWLVFFQNIFNQTQIVSFANETRLPFEIYNIVGQKVDLKGNMPAGIYILKMEETTTRILIKE